MTSGWMQAAIFNAMLLLLPLLAANVVSGIYATRDFPQTPRPAALEETRTQVKAQFASLIDESVDRRSGWARLVDLQLRERNLPAARGFLLAAPEMLDARDREAILNAAPQAVPFGTRDEQLIGAALLFLPNDVRVRYETALRPAELEMAEPEAETVEPDSPVAAPRTIRASAVPNVGFSVLGTPEDLLRNTRDWLAAPEDDGFSIRITALGLMADELELPTSVDLHEATSLLKVAERSGRLTPGLRESLTDDLEDVLPLQDLRTRLTAVTATVAPISEQAVALQTAVRESLQTDQMDAFVADATQINKIVDAVGPVAALALVEHVNSASDLRRARLVAEAGGDLSVALEAITGRGVLATARTGVELTREDVLEIMGLAAAAMALFWMVMLSMQRYMASPIRPLRYE